MAKRTQKERLQAIQAFIDRWSTPEIIKEKQETHPFWESLLYDVFDIQRPDKWLIYEKTVSGKNQEYIDVYIPETRVLIEQKSSDKDLFTPLPHGKQMLTAYDQALSYRGNLKADESVRWIITCNFREFHIYDMNNIPKRGGVKAILPTIIRLEELIEEASRLQFIVDTKQILLDKEQELSMKAGDIIGAIYDKLLAQYDDATDAKNLASLNQLCVRLVFCLFAEDAGLFGEGNEFHDYLKDVPAPKLRKTLIELFNMLDKPTEQRDKYEEEQLLAFPYVNGGLFSKEDTLIPQITDEIRNLLLDKASEGFNWSKISPTIFGSLFESTLNQVTRREGGMHYTSIENIHKVIDPLFLNDLQAEKEKVLKSTNKKDLRAFQEKLASLRFFDPACGSGNFLTETYISLRRIENEIIQKRYEGKRLMGDLDNPILVNIHQFYGIEINDFAVAVAKTALWIAEEQMLRETERIVSFEGKALPLKNYNNIVEGNALRIDWKEIIAPQDGLYIIGNPPFNGARLMNHDQKDDLKYVFGNNWKNLGDLDYVSGWFKVAIDYMRGTNVRTALVATNSITQGQSVCNVWKTLFESGVHFDFAYHTFKWNSESDKCANVHCVIIGFSLAENNHPRLLFEQPNQHKKVQNINAYLIPEKNMFIDNRTKPLCDVPKMRIGNKPIDDGNYLFSKVEKEDFIAQEPASAKYFKPWYGSFEFINNKPRYCLWLGECPPQELRKMPHCLQRVENVRNFRLASKSAGTVKLANHPTRFHVENMPEGSYIVIPETSSENRLYIPMGFMDSSVLCSNALRLVPDATLYHFGVLTSSVHMAWMRIVCGRLKSDYRYSKDIVYNNFPWQNISDRAKQQIEQTAQAILDARVLYPNASLADLYDELTMPIELRKAHEANDRAVMKAYGFRNNMTETEIVTELMKRYEELTKEK